MGRGPQREVVDPVVSERIGKNAATSGIEGLLSLALLVLFRCFVIVKTTKVADFCWVIVALTTRLPDETWMNNGEVHLGSASRHVDAAGLQMQRKRRRRNTAVGTALMQGTEVVVGK